MKCKDVYDDTCKTDYLHLITSLFRVTTGLEVEKFKILFEYLDPGENFEIIKYHQLTKEVVKISNIINLQRIRRKKGQIFCLHQVFCNWHQNQVLKGNILVLTHYFFSLILFYHS